MNINLKILENQNHPQNQIKSANLMTWH